MVKGIMLTNFHSKYKVECKVGEGSFSEVLKCQEKTTGKLVAAKQLKKHFKSISHASEIPELMVLRKISKHPNLLELYDSYFDPSNGKVTLVFELMDMSLYDLMKTRKRSIPENRAKKFLYQIIKGIDHLHYHGIFHRDIKPENVLVKGEKVKISDMGSIKGFYSKQPYTEYISTRWYRSPECLLTKGFYGPKMDVWAIGCVYYELLTLKPLFPGSDELDQISKINNILGSPSSKLMNKLKKVKCRNLVPAFPHKKGTGLNSIIPMMTDEGREIFKQMIVYDPDSRINVRRLLEHKYFNDIRQEELLTQRLLSNQTISAVSRLSASPMWLSFITATRKRRLKRKTSRKASTEKKVLKKQTSLMPRIATVPSSEVSYSNNTGCSGENDGNTNQVYSMKPSVNKEETVVILSDDESMGDDNLFTIHPDRIPGYDKFSKKKMLQNISTKVLEDIDHSEKRSKDNHETIPINQLNRNSISRHSVYEKQMQEYNSNQIDNHRFELQRIQNNNKEILCNKQVKTENIQDGDRRYMSNSNMIPAKLKNEDTGQSIADLKDDRRKIERLREKSLRAGSSVRYDPYQKNQDNSPKLRNKFCSSITVVETSKNIPTTADMRKHISSGVFQKRNLLVSRLMEDEVVNLAQMPERRNCAVINKSHDIRLKRYYSGPTRKTPSSYFGPMSRVMAPTKGQSINPNIIDENTYGDRNVPTKSIRSSMAHAHLNLKPKQPEKLMLHRRMGGPIDSKNSVSFPIKR